MLKEKKTEYLDDIICRLKATKTKWANLAVVEKIHLLNKARENIGQHAQKWVDLALKNKHLATDSPYAGEEWSTGPWALAYAASEYNRTLKHIQTNSLQKLVKKTTVRNDGQLKVDVFPSNYYEKLIFSKVKGEIWMQKGVTSKNLEDHMALFYKENNPKGKVSLVLGAGNINSIAPLDMLYKMIVCGEVVLLKMNPVNDYLIPVFEIIFEEFINNNFLAIIGGGAEVGQYLTSHPDIETIHITGSKHTHNAIVYGPGEEGENRKKKNEPILDSSKEITSELGNVGPMIIVPGPWNKADILYQAENIVTAKLHNSGHNCAAAQVFILPENWTKSQDIIDNVSHLMKTLPTRKAYYPGSEERQKESVSEYPDADQLTEGIPRTLITGLHADKPDEFAYQNEFFSAVFAQTSIQGDTAIDYLRNAVRFCNETLKGTLGVNLIIHPKTIQELGPELENCISDLKYGTVAINIWSAAAFLLPQSSWGAFPGHTYDDIQSGIGTVRNSLMFDKPEKTVYYGPFRSLPRALNLAPPRPPWFVTNKTAHITMKRITKFAVNPGIRHLPGIIYSALRG